MDMFQVDEFIDFRQAVRLFRNSRASTVELIHVDRLQKEIAQTVIENKGRKGRRQTVELNPGFFDFGKNRKTLASNSKYETHHGGFRNSEGLDNINEGEDESEEEVKAKNAALTQPHVTSSSGSSSSSQSSSSAENLEDQEAFQKKEADKRSAFLFD